MEYAAYHRARDELRAIAPEVLDLAEEYNRLGACAVG